MFTDPLILTIIIGSLLIFILGTFICSILIYKRGVELNPLFEKKEHLKKDIESRQNTLSDLNEQLKSLRDEKAVAERTISEGKSEREWLDNNYNTVADLKRQIEYAKEELTKIIDNTNQRKEDLDKVLSDLQENVGKNQELLRANERLLKDNESLDIQKKNLQKEREFAESEKVQIEEKIYQCQQEYLKKSAELKDLENQISEHERKLRDVQTQIHDLHTQKQNLETLLSNLKKILEAKEKDCMEKIEALGQQYQAEAEKYRGLNQKLQEQYEKTENRLKMEEDKLRQDLDRLKNSYHVEEEKLNNLVSERIKAEPVNEETRWGDLNRPVIAQSSSKKQKLSENEWLEEFLSNLTSCGIKFHKRMIYAFHTGLKVADYSPIVVLAGISGTGKSLLPQLYSKAIGMNFLQLAVQPRWDNPQDMFGFYNYMEGRYKATELSRLLWQFDIYNNPDVQKKFAKSAALPMNLVLLDEMNLAKVEYYFSDMLSRLEVRRSLMDRENNQRERHNAEIKIECGATKEISAAKRLFVGRNTLFVGTMNEDESTQALSDKVMDRANVLRFGKPNDLLVQPETGKFLEIYKEPCVMDFGTWTKNWFLSETHEAEKLGKTLSAINDELAQIGRPFAYRVFSAIQAYVNNYPLPGEEGYRNALADQIEMKILPKLNGVDKESSRVVQEVLNKIGDIIHDVGDEDLEHAFGNALNNTDEAFFQWRGVSR